VNIQTQATAGLYNYTPYQPNSAALANLSGTGDSCSAYGNRNFWRYFNDWFGSTYAISSSWQWVGQATYADSSRTLPVDPETLSPNTTYYLTLKARNMGPAPWKTGTVNLATSNPGDRKSIFCDSSWLNYPDTCSRPATLQESSVAPTTVGTFEFSIKTPSNYGTYTEYFRPVVEGQLWMDDVGLNWQFGIKPPTYASAYNSQSTYTDAAHTKPVNTAIMSPNTTYYVVFKARNTGNTTWSNSGANPVRLGTSNPIDRSSTFCDSSWLSCNRAAALQEASIAPGEIGTFAFWVKVPYAVDGTKYFENFRPLSEGLTWMNDQGLFQEFDMDSTDYSWAYIDQSAYTDSSRTQTANLGAAKTSTTYYLRLHVKNIGGQIWNQSFLRLGTNSPVNRISQFCDSSWLSCNRPAKLVEQSVSPGQTGTFEFSVKTPPTAGSYNENFRPVADGITWLEDLGQYWAFTTSP
jgi:hypothetical protein